MFCILRRNVLAILLCISLLIPFKYSFGLVKAQVPWISKTLANVTVKGYLDNIFVNDVPINFTVGIGLAPATANNPKQREPEGIPYINISAEDPSTPEYTNVQWNVSINASDIMDDQGHSIPVFNIKFNSCSNVIPNIINHINS